MYSRKDLYPIFKRICPEKVGLTKKTKKIKSGPDSKMSPIRLGFDIIFVRAFFFSLKNNEFYKIVSPGQNDTFNFEMKDFFWGEWASNPILTHKKVSNTIKLLCLKKS